MNRDITSFEEAKKLSLKKWKTIKSRIIDITCALSDDCGFCIRIDQLYPQSEYARECPKCEAKNLCNACIFPIDDALTEAENLTRLLIKKIEALKEKKP